MSNNKVTKVDRNPEGQADVDLSCARLARDDNKKVYRCRLRGRCTFFAETSGRAMNE